MNDGCCTNITLITPDDISSMKTQEKDKRKLRALVDSGADLNFISSSLAEVLIEKGVGYKGKGIYRITDAFTVERTFYENLTFKFKFDDLKDKENDREFTIKAVIIDIPLQCDCILGLLQIKKDGIFRILPWLVGESIEA